MFQVMTRTAAAVCAVLAIACSDAVDRAETAGNPGAAPVPEVTIEIYDALGGGLRPASSDVEYCDDTPPHLGVPNGTPTEKKECVLPPRDFSDVLKESCECNVDCLRPYFDHNKNRGPAGTMQMYTPPDSRRYYPGVPSSKHWEHGVTQNIFTFDVELTNFYEQDWSNVAVVLVEVTPDNGRQGFQDSRPHACLNDDHAVWTFGHIKAGETAKRTVKMWLPDDAPFRITGYIVSLDCPANSEAADSDGDGLSDAAEAELGLDPFNPDTDDDGLFDGAETNTGVYAGWWNTGTDPLVPDTDGDCFIDGDEIAENTNPFDPNDHPERRCTGYERNLEN